MPQVDCPRCGRQIPLDHSELMLLIECADCGTRFYPMMPLDEPLPSAPSLARSAKQSTRSAEIREARPSPAETESAPNVPPLFKKRKPRKKKETEWLPVIVGVSLSLVLLIGFGIGVVILIKFDVFGSVRPVPAEPAADRKAAPTPAPAPFRPAPAQPSPSSSTAPSTRPPEAEPADPALPPPSGKTVDLGAPPRQP